MRSTRQTNLALLALVPLATVTGLLANAAGTRWGIHPSVLHGIVALAILILAPWKQVSIRSGLRKRTSWVSLALLTSVIFTLTTGILHVVGYAGRLGPLTVMQVHVGGGLLALILAGIHYRSHRVRLVRSVDVSRRSFLKAGTLAAGAAASWLALEGLFDLVGSPGGERRFTGSHERGPSSSGFPVTSWLDDRVQHIAANEWGLMVQGRRLDLSSISALPQEEVEAVLDCTSGWYTRQVWRGVRLDTLLEANDHRSIVVTSSTGYSRRLPAPDADRLWLATHVGGEPLSEGHGYPARLVAPGRRGFWWVKWVEAIATSDVPWWVQLPFPAA